MPEYCTRPEAAVILSDKLGLLVTKRILEKYAERGEGPPYVILFGRAAYPRADLLAWAESAARVPRARAFREKRTTTLIAA
jgi:hypothetical protein